MVKDETPNRFGVLMYGEMIMDETTNLSYMTLDQANNFADRLLKEDGVTSGFFSQKDDETDGSNCIQIVEVLKTNVG